MMSKSTICIVLLAMVLMASSAQAASSYTCPLAGASYTTVRLYKKNGNNWVSCTTGNGCAKQAFTCTYKANGSLQTYNGVVPSTVASGCCKATGMTSACVGADTSNVNTC